MDLQTEQVLLRRHEAGDKTATNQLMIEMMRTVRRVAFRLIRQMPPHAHEINDLVQEGLIGLMASLASFDSSRKLRLTTYAALRIRGAMLDACRKKDCVSRVSRLRGNTTQHIATDFTDWELPSHRYGTDPTHEVETDDFWQHYTRWLNANERHVLIQNMRYGRPLWAIGKEMGLSETRCWQMLKQSLRLIRERREQP
jgi:RNA polymerase sigma factor for flagellar operon FliA